MAKKVILAVAGSGKSTYLVNQLDLKRRALIVTYTTNNLKNLRAKIIKKFDHFPENIKLLPYFTFLHSFCFKPFLLNRLKTKGIVFEQPPLFPKDSSKRGFYVTGSRLFSNRIAKAIEVGNVVENVNKRIEKYYDCLFIDEIQDIAGNDFNLLKHLAKANVDLLLVGDFYQHTFDTSRDGNVNQSLFENYLKYQQQFTKMGVDIDQVTLNKSYRCSPTTCAYIKQKIGIDIDSHREEGTSIHIIDCKEKAAQIFRDDTIVKLFYREHYNHACYSRNWGDCKGEDKFESVCIVLNKTTQKMFNKDTLHELNPQTKNKFYVACSRARRDLYFMSDTLLANSD